MSNTSIQCAPRSDSPTGVSYAFQVKTVREDLRYLGSPGTMLRIGFRGLCTEVPDACRIAVYEG